MKKTIARLAAILVISALALTPGCKKAEKGDKGDKGDTGAAGSNGVANIQTYTAYISNWVPDGTDYTATVSVPIITSEVVSKGTIQVWIDASGGSGASYEALPYAYYGFAMNYTFSVGQITLRFSELDGSQALNPGAGFIKVVAIPPSMIKPNVNMRDYNEVKAAYNLKD